MARVVLDPVGEADNVVPGIITKDTSDDCAEAIVLVATVVKVDVSV